MAITMGVMGQVRIAWIFIVSRTTGVGMIMLAIKIIPMSVKPENK
jgi:hypothetical protein